MYVRKIINFIELPTSDTRTTRCFLFNSDDHFAIAVAELAFDDENWQKKQMQ